MQATNKSRTYELVFTAICLITVMVSMLVRVRYMNMPFERDEGEYAYAGQLILKGIAPYIQAYNMKFPGTYLSYAFFILLFGHSVAAIRIGVLLLEVVQYVFIYKTARQLFSWQAGLLAVVIMSLLNMSINAQAINTNAEHFVITFTIIGLYYLVKSEARPSLVNYFAVGFFFALAVLMKQHAIYFIPIIFLVCVYHLVARKQYYAMAYLLGGAVPMICTALWLYLSGAFGAFKYWCFDYAKEYVGLNSNHQAWLNFYNYGRPIFNEYRWIGWAAMVGLIALMFDRNIRLAHKILLLAFVVASGLSITPGYYFRPHYFILLFPAFALVAAYFANRVFTLASLYFPRLVLVALTVCCSWYFVQNFKYCFIWGNSKVLGYMYTNCDPFDASIKMAAYIKSITNDTDRICCVVPEPEIYFYTDRKSATPYIYIYPLLERQKYVDQMTADFFSKVKAAHAKVLVVRDKGWLPGNHQDTVLYNFFKKYQDEYELKAILYSTKNEEGVCNDVFLTDNGLADSIKMPWWAFQTKIMTRKPPK